MWEGRQETKKLQMPSSCRTPLSYFPTLSLRPTLPYRTTVSHASASGRGKGGRKRRPTLSL